MKTTLAFLSAFMLMAFSVKSQDRLKRIDKLVIPKQDMQLQADIRVFDAAEDTTSRVARLDGFLLKAGERRAVVRTGDVISKIETPATDTVISSGEGLYMLPELYYARVEGTEVQISFRILFIDTGPLRYNFESELFEGRLRFLPVEVNESGQVKSIRKRLSIPEQIIVSYDRESVPLSIGEVNWPPVDLEISARDPEDSLTVNILTISNPSGYQKSLMIEPAILISSARTVMQGMGIQTLPLHVMLKGVSEYGPVTAGLESTLGSIDPDVLLLGGNHPGKAVLRSESIGQIGVRVVNSSFRSNSITVEAVFPWLFLLLAIVGGLIGGLGKNLSGRRKISIRPLALGSIFGLIAAFAYWGLGILLIGFSVETRGLNEAMVFGLGLVAGYFGLVAIRKPAA